MKPLCKIRPNHEVMEALLLHDCVTHIRIQIREELQDQMKPITLPQNLDFVQKYYSNLNYCQTCMNYQGEYPELPKIYR